MTPDEEALVIAEQRVMYLSAQRRTAEAYIAILEKRNAQLLERAEAAEQRLRTFGVQIPQVERWKAQHGTT